MDQGTYLEYLSDLPSGFGFNAVIVSDIPVGSGLSSSAAIEVATALLLERIVGLNVPNIKRALRCQAVEHKFIGLPSGIMDQLISIVGEPGKVALIDCKYVFLQKIYIYLTCLLAIFSYPLIGRTQSNRSSSRNISTTRFQFC